MAKYSSIPWFRKAKNTWYYWHNGQQISLGVKGKDSRSEALKVWAQKLAEGSTTTNPTTPIPIAVPEPEPKVKEGSKEESSQLTLQSLSEAFLADSSLRLKPPSIRLYRMHFDAFVKHFGSGKEAAKLTSAEVIQWLASLPLSSTTKAMHLRSILAGFNWAVRQEMLTVNVVRRVPKPKSKSRSEEAVISESDHQKLLAGANPQLQLLLKVLWATGCRPAEATRFTVESFDPKAGVVKLYDHKTDRTGKPRLIFIPDDIVKLLKVEVTKVKTGALLRNQHGRAWKLDTLAQALRKLRKRVKVKAVIAYGYRHTFATSALVAGNSDSIVAALLGHTSTAMLHRHYSHLTSQSHAMREALVRVRG